MRTDNLLYIYKPGETNIRTTANKDSGVVYYQDTVILVDEYLQQHPGYIVGTWDEIYPMILSAEEKEFILLWVEVTEKDFLEALECLPPDRWQRIDGCEFFQMSERLTSDITATYAKIQDRFFCANRRESDNYEKLLAEINNQFFFTRRG